MGARHEAVTGIATAGDVRLLQHLVTAERDRMDAAEAEQRLSSEADYASPFIPA